jgi:hypothetical protein
MHIYDYLFAGVIIIALLLGSTIMVTTFSSPASIAADKDLLKIAAEKIMIQVLLDPGYPYNWGSDNTNPQDLKVFGLAKCGETSRQAYELDPDKVLRINSALEGSGFNFVNAITAANLLSLNNTQGSLDYGFTLEFNETLQVNISPLGNDEYSVSVLSDYALPIMGATVSATLYYVNGVSIFSVGPVYNQTSYGGNCILDLYNSTAYYSFSKVLVVAVDYYGDQATKFFNAGNSVPTSLFRNSILPYPNSSSYNMTAGSDCREIILIQNTTGIETRDFKMGYSVNSTNFTLDNIPEPFALGVLAVSQEQQLIYAQRDFLDISYRTIPAIRSAASAYSLERTVFIGGATYTATLYFWRMSS